MVKKLISNTLIYSALSAGSLCICACDSSTSNGLGNFNGGEKSESVTSAVAGEGIDTDFQPIVERFRIEAEKRGISVNLNGLDIQYGETDGAYGVCSSLFGDSKDIVIDPSLAHATDDFRSEIVLHELGHCILGREHNNDPTSIMHSTRIIGKPWRKSVLDELFVF